MLDAQPITRSKADRLFFALLPDAETAARIARLAEALKQARRFTGRLIRPEHLHVSLFFLGAFDGLPERILARACEAAAAVRAPPFTIAFDRSASFGRDADKHPFVLLGGDAALLALRAALGAALMARKLGHVTRAPFTPHMTLLYDARFADEAPLSPVAWTAREIVLVHSHYGQTRHEHLARFALGAH
ncbi:MAG: RNA 2',3'-cyclic phosphodiesterase [Rhizomicrobium sp.]